MHLSILSQICQLPGKVNIVITTLRMERLGLGAVAPVTQGLSEASLQTCWGKINT